MLMQNQIMEITRNMKLTRHVTQAKVRFKDMVGLPKRASNIEVLQYIGYVYADNGIGAEFNDYINKYNMTEYGIQLVDESPIAQLN
jgi:hypothetical protein